MVDIDERQVLEFLRTQVAKRTGLSVEAIGPDSTFSDCGLKSIDAVLISGEVEEKFEIEIDPAEIFEHETLGDFTRSITAGSEA